MTNQAAQAAARLLQGLNLGGLTAQDYANAAAAERAGAAGYSGGLQQTVGDAAARVQHDLSAAGSPAQAQNQSAAAGNVLYGLGGNLPANQLDYAGPLVAAQQRALPAQTLGYGQAEATGILGAGQQRAEGLTPDILAAREKQAGIAADYFAQLAKDASERGQDAIANAYKALSAQQASNRDALSAYNANYRAQVDAYSAEQLAGYRQGQLDLGAQRAAATAAYQSGMLRERGRANDIAQRRADQPGNIQVIGSDATGRSYINQKGQLVPLPGRLGKPVPGSGTKPKRLTITQRKDSIARANNGAAQLAGGGNYDKQGNFTPGGGYGLTKDGKIVPAPPVSFQEAVAEFHREGYWASPELAKIAMKALNDAYAPLKSISSAFQALPGSISDLNLFGNK